MNHGGKREGAGRKPKYGEPTEVISHRVPISLVGIINKYINSKLKKFKAKCR